MPFIPMKMEDVQESKPVPQGRYNVVITACEETVTRETQKPQFRISIGFEDQIGAATMTHYMGIPGEGDEPNKAQFKALLIKRFCSLFKIPMRADGIDTNELAMAMLGARANAEVSLSEPDQKGAIYNRLEVPRMREESTAGVPKPPKR